MTDNLFPNGFESSFPLTAFGLRGSKRNVLDHGFVKLVDWMGGDAAVVQAARVSYGDGTKTVREDKALINYLMKNRHTSPFEQIQFKFHVSAPLFVFRQWHRHRTWSYNEVSARYSEMPDEFYIPEVSRITTQDTKNRQGSTDRPIKKAQEARALILAASTAAYGEYQKLLKMGVARETARAVLPVNLYSQMYASVSAHNLMGFLRLRLDPHAQYEIRCYAEAMLELARPVAPISFEAWAELDRDGDSEVQ
jgi:thymidylate synthase (FAD)